jgi:NAD(P)-dependent dehydrogenase (short-subunit alcohol dehydrogenase family)
MSAAQGLLAGRRVIVSGGANPRGIGRAIITLFLAQGARVACVDLDEVGAGTPGADAILGLRCDVRSAESCREAVAAATAAFGGVDIVVNNAGIVGATPVWELQEEEFVRMIDINLNGAFRLTRAALPALMDSARTRPGQAAIVNMGSMAAMRGGGLLGRAHYATSKGGIHSLTKALAKELGPQGIRANAIAPGIIATDMTVGKFGDAMEASLKAGLPLRRFGTADEVAKTALFLASDLSSYCTGTVIDVNGGFHIH